MEKLTFHDFVRLDDQSTQIVLRQLDQPLLAVALAHVGDAVTEKIHRNMSERAVRLLREDMAQREPILERDAVAKRTEVEAVMQRLHAAGEIRIAS